MTGQIVSIIEQRARTRFVERSLGVLTLAWGLLLLGPWSTFGVSPSYRVMAVAAPEWLWGAVMTAAGAITLGMQLNGNLWTRRVLNAIGCALWLLIAMGFLLASPASGGSVVYSWIAGNYVLVFLWLNQEARG